MTAQYDICARLTGPGDRLDAQTDCLGDVETGAVIPLLPPDEALRIVRYLNPSFRVDGNCFVPITHFVSAVPIAETAEQRGNFRTDRVQVARALDRLLQDLQRLFILGVSSGRTVDIRIGA